MIGSDDPRFWTEVQWHARALKVCALFDGMSAAQADILLQNVGKIIAGSSVFRMESPVFQDLVHMDVCDKAEG